MSKNTLSKGQLTIQAMESSPIVKYMLASRIYCNFIDFDIKDSKRNPKTIVDFTKSGTIFVNKKTNLSVDELAFMMTVCIMYLVNKDFNEKQNELNEKSLVLYCINYVYTKLKFKDVPRIWICTGQLGLEELKSINSTKDFLSANLDVLSKVPYFALDEKNLAKECLVDIREKDSNHIYRKSTSVRAAYVAGLKKIIQDSIEEKKNANFGLEFQNSDKDSNDAKGLISFNKALTFINLHFPLLASISDQMNYVVNSGFARALKIEYAAVYYKEKKIIINPANELTVENYKFLIAHELLHVALKHNTRRGSRDPLMWNLACDFIINRWLLQMGLGIPVKSIYLDPELLGLSAEEIYTKLKNNVKLLKTTGTLRTASAGKLYKERSKNNPFATNVNKNSLDIIDLDEQFDFNDFEDACARLLLEGLFIHQYGSDVSRGTLPLDLEEEIKVINQPPIDWNAKLADWFMINFPQPKQRRTFSRFSRRQATTPDIPRPSYMDITLKERSKTFGVVIDSSGSMSNEIIGKCLGVIRSFAVASKVKEVRVVYCDAMPYDMGYISVETLLDKVKVYGRGGTYLQPAIGILEGSLDFPKDAPILVLTDGEFEEKLEINRENGFVVPKKSIMANVPNANCTVFEFS